MATYVRDHLCWLYCVWFLRIVHLVVINLWMGYHTCNTSLYALLQTFHTTQEASLVIIREWSTQSVTDVIRERCNAWHLWNSSLHRQLIMRISTSSSAPSLSINEYLGVNSIEFTTDIIHSLNVMNAHEVYTEAVDVILFDPVFH